MNLADGFFHVFGESVTSILLLLFVSSSVTHPLRALIRELDYARN